MLTICNNALNNKNKTAIISSGHAYNYEQLLEESASLAGILLDGLQDLREARVAFIITPGYDYVKTQWAIWRAGGIAVPLCITYPLPSLDYVLEDTKATTIVADEAYYSFILPLAIERNIKLIHSNNLSKSNDIELPEIPSSRKAMILYTSGTTNKPKGVVSTHENIEAQITSLVDAWEWTQEDHILCVLPLHHVHGIINVVSCALWSGAIVEFLPSFSAKNIFDLFLLGRINLFMAVPTIYFKLISYFDSLDPLERKNITEALSKFRLMVSGSAALPVSVLEKWKIVSTHTLLERYGMTEIGMAISNPYQGERKPGCIGLPLANVDVRLVDDNNNPLGENEPGAIQVKGKNVFLEYWNNPTATKKSFTEDGWFITGDVAIIEDGYYKILGRDSIDIIKSGGYKISALEIEEVLRTHPQIEDCSVIGIPDEEWGEIVSAVLILKDKQANLNEINTWLKERMPAYKTPRNYKIIEDLPRNAMGKVTKNDLKRLF
jgi:malonyl-CoA/methylmalonyl-CoA synthetase